MGKLCIQTSCSALNKLTLYHTLLSVERLGKRICNTNNGQQESINVNLLKTFINL